jgi:hypothetical protein
MTTEIEILLTRSCPPTARRRELSSWARMPSPKCLQDPGSFVRHLKHSRARTGDLQVELNQTLDANGRTPSPT